MQLILYRQHPVNLLTYIFDIWSSKSKSSSNSSSPSTDRLSIAHASSWCFLFRNPLHPQKICWVGSGSIPDLLGSTRWTSWDSADHKMIPSLNLLNKKKNVFLKFKKTINLSGHFRKKLNLLSCPGSLAGHGKVGADLLHLLNSRRCKMTFDCFFTFYIWYAGIWFSNFHAYGIQHVFQLLHIQYTELMKVRQCFQL